MNKHVVKLLVGLTTVSMTLAQPMAVLADESDKIVENVDQTDKIGGGTGDSVNKESLTSGVKDGDETPAKDGIMTLGLEQEEESELQKKANNIALGLSADVSQVVAGNEIVYTVTIKNNNSTDITANTCKLVLKLAGGISSVNVQAKGTSFIGAAKYDKEEGTVEIPVNKKISKNSQTRTLYITAYTDKNSSTNKITASLTGILSENDNTASVDGGSAESSLITSKYAATQKVGIMGAYLGGKYNGNGSTTLAFDPGFTDSAVLDTLENVNITIGKGNPFKQLGADNTQVDENGIVAIGDDGNTWTCVGFVPYTQNNASPTSSDHDELFKYVFYSGDSLYPKENNDVANKNKTLDEVKQYITDNNGILYGQSATESFLKAIAGTTLVKNYKEAFMAAVWYVESAGESYGQNKYGYTIPSISAVPYYTYADGTVTEETNAESGKTFTYSSEGVTISTSKKLVHSTESGNDYYDGTITITLAENAPDSVKINLSDAIGFLNGTATGTAADDRDDTALSDAVQPGDTIRYKINFVNNSSKNYSYDGTKSLIGTIPASTPQEGETVVNLGTGFEGYTIKSVGKFSYAPRRIANRPLQDLGLDDHYNQPTDDNVGYLLYTKKGYGADLLSDEAKTALSNVNSQATFNAWWDENIDALKNICKQYLAQYYLDWFNNRSSRQNNPANSFADLTATERKILTDGTCDTAILETCQPSAEALYYFAYHDIYTFDGAGLYDRMTENGKTGSYADTIVTSLLKDGKATVTSKFAGYMANNGFQRTKYGWGMQFELNVTSTPDEPGTPSTPDTPNTPTTPEGTTSETTQEVLGAERPVETVAVLGATREEEQEPAVLGATRGAAGTGDDTHMVLWGVAAAAAIGLLVLYFALKRRRDR